VEIDALQDKPINPPAAKILITASPFLLNDDPLRRLGSPKKHSSYSGMEFAFNGNAGLASGGRSLRIV
jgi:hypothetical protein